MNHPPSARLLAALCLLLPFAARAQSGIVRDGSLGTGPAGPLLPAGTVQFNGNSYQKIAIPEAYGTRAGGNIFHSFKSFSIAPGDGAVFGTTAPASNIIARVTGGTVSQIAGLLSVEAGAGAPNLFLINPAGVSFSAGAALDVPGALHVSTASTLVFPNGEFGSDPARASTLHSAEPAAFGFSGAQPGVVFFQDGVQLQASGPLTVAAGAIRLDGASIGTLHGDLRLAAVGGVPAAIALTGALPGGLDGQFAMSNAYATTLTSTHQAAGNLSVSAGDIALGGDSTLGSASLTGASGAAGVVELAASGTLALTRGASIVANSYGSGAGGAVRVNAENIALDGGGQFGGVFSYTGGSGAGAPLTLAARQTLTVAYGASVASQSDGAGASGAVKLSAAKLALHDGGVVSTFATGGGDAGAIGLAAGDLSLGGGAGFSAVYSTLAADAPGAAGAISLQTGATLRIANGGLLFTRSGAAPGGDIDVQAGSVVIDGETNSAGIKTSTQGRNSAAGNITLRSGADLVLRNSGYVLSDTQGKGASGALDISARNIDISGFLSGIGSDVGTTAQGNAGAVRVSAQERLLLRAGASITSASLGAGNAGSVRLQAADLEIDGAGLSTFVSSSVLPTSSGNAGQVDLIATGNLSLLGGAQVSSDTSGSGNAGAITVRAASMLVENRAPQLAEYGAQSGVTTDALPDSSGDAGSIDIGVSGHLALLGGANITSDLRGSGEGGVIRIGAGSITLGGTPERLALITTTTTTGTRGNAGSIRIQATGLLAMPGDGHINTRSEGSGDGGAVQIRAGAIDMGGHAGPAFILSDASAGSIGNAGALDIAAAGHFLMGEGAFIQSGTHSSGKGGAIAIEAGSLRMQAGTQLADISSSASEGSSGHAGNIRIKTSGAFEMFNGAGVSSDTSGRGNAGRIDVDAGSILFDGKGNESLTGILGLVREEGSGNGGALSVLVRGALVLRDGAEITSSTYGSGHAGSVSVAAASAEIVTGARKLARIASDSEAGSSGNAGRVDVQVDGDLVLRNRGLITSATGGSGEGGALSVAAANVLLDESEISASATAGSSGKTGSLALVARDSLILRNNSGITMSNDAKVDLATPLQLNGMRVAAPRILLDRSAITTRSYGNVAAAPLSIDVGDTLLLRNEAIINSGAEDGNGGAVSVRAGKLIGLENGRIFTSVYGTAGNGGDISVDAPTLLMQTGLIQANTSAANSKGGDISLRVGTLLASGSSLFIGGATRFVYANEVFGLNVIQAAAPDGVSGSVAIAAPALDLGGSLDALPVQQIDAGGVGRNPCQAHGGSTLSSGGQGALPPSARALLDAGPAPAKPDCVKG